MFCGSDREADAFNSPLLSSSSRQSPRGCWGSPRLKARQAAAGWPRTSTQRLLSVSVSAPQPPSWWRRLIIRLVFFCWQRCSSPFVLSCRGTISFHFVSFNFISLHFIKEHEKTVLEPTASSEGGKPPPAKES